MIGESVRRLEDRPLLLGRAKFIADVSFPNEAHLRVVRSEVASGLIVDIDVSEALQSSGVVGVWTGEDLAPVPPIDFRQIGYDELVPYRQPVLARESVRYVGEPVAIVVAEDAYVAEDIAELVVVDIEPLEIEPVEAMLLESEYGSVDQAFSEAHRILELELTVGRHSGIPMETRGLLARPNPDTGRLELHGASKVPHYTCAAISAMLDLEPHSVVGRECAVGGGFGIRGELYPEDVLVSWAALRLNRPVKWIEDRREHLIAANHSRDQRHLVKAAVSRDGLITAVDDEFWYDQGAYVRTHGATVPSLTAAMLPGPYAFPAYRSRGHICLSNKTPAGTYRAPGRFEATFVCERVVEAVARVMGLDPVTVRRRNLISADAMPFDRQLSVLGTSVVLDSGDYPLILDRMVDHIEFERLDRELAQRRADGELVGLGIGMFVEKSGLGPFEDVQISIRENGSVEVVTGAASVGQGIETIIAQICADDLDMDYRNIEVIHGQTDRISRGLGAFASRVTVMTGSATRLVTDAVKRIARDVASDILEASAEDLEYRAGAIGVRGQPDRSLTLGEIAAAIGGELRAEASFTADHMTYPYGAHAVVVDIDPHTGAVKIERYVVAYDVGRAINPMLIEGQIQGGAAQGIGGALLEEFLYDSQGQPLVTSFMDYLMPTASETPAVEVLLSEDAPSPHNPLGAKGAGEGGTNACGAALASAIEQAIGRPGTVTDLPITASKIKALMKSAP
ncbi:xanthine dehydrogenase family protein molybdopterin-binding subunit [Candidatus Poriferisocius sp.]|uniref:xanthine dehydrogenase family protein molybdopterin-binding subunit n=1 Tax=Candidatus Poriferisocius sp. TaxID=3101276 RepID=UPI003B52B293